MVKDDTGVDWWIGSGWKNLLDIKRDYAKREGVSMVGGSNWLKYLQSIDQTKLTPHKRRVVDEFKADLVLFLIEERSQ
jgi:hypothetical protein